MKLSGQSILVTGATGAIGQAICHALVAHGANVVVHYGRNRDAAEALVKSARWQGLVRVSRSVGSGRTAGLVGSGPGRCRPADGPGQQCGHPLRGRDRCAYGGMAARLGARDAGPSPLRPIGSVAHPVYVRADDGADMPGLLSSIPLQKRLGTGISASFHSEDHSELMRSISFSVDRSRKHDICQ